MLFSEKAAKAKSDGNTTVRLTVKATSLGCVHSSPAACTIQHATCVPRAGCRTGACLLFKTLSWQDGLQWRARCLPLEVPQNSRGGLRRQTLVLWGLRIAVDIEILNGGCALGLLFQGLWWPLNTQRLRKAAPFLLCKGWPPPSNPKRYEQPARGNSGLLGLCEQFLLLPSQKKWSR